MYYDGTPIALGPRKTFSTPGSPPGTSTARNFPHYFLKEISEAPLSVARTLQNRWKMAVTIRNAMSSPAGKAFPPDRIAQALADERIRRIYFIGQGTAGMAAQAISDILDYYLNEPSLKISAMKASELSGFQWTTAAMPTAWPMPWWLPSANRAPPPTPTAPWTWCAPAAPTMASSTAAIRT
jgi:glutamine---fructose-6-phosphate transaminase (isomerizing)